jgi:branched-chain amino acid transport system permease protein
MTTTEVEPKSGSHPLYPPPPSSFIGRYRTVLSTIGVFAFLAVLPWIHLLEWTSVFASGNSFGRGNLALVFAFAAAAVGFNLLVGHAGALGLAHAGLFGLGAYGTAILSAPRECTAEGCDPVVRIAVSGYDWPFFLALPVVCLGAALVGVIFGFPAARLRGFYLAIATLALGELLITLIRLDDEVWSGLRTNGGTGKQVPLFTIPGTDVVLSAYMMSLGTLLIVFVAYVVLTQRRLGRTLKAVRDIEIATGPIGISATYYKLLAFGLSAFAAAMAGAMWSQNTAFVNPSAFRQRLLVFLLVVLIVGGLGRLWGPLIGAFFFVLLRQKLQDTQKLLFLILGISLMLSVLILPSGFASLPDRISESRYVKDLRKRVASMTGFEL